ncbi:hypothetical protein GPK87_12535 [Oscillibacter sp. MCC667]|nr:hypothetical protein [Oscillibacter sp. MCC667]
MTTEIVGKAHRKGVGKVSGKPYDFTEVHYLGRRRGVEGLAAVSKSVGAEVIVYDDITIGAYYAITHDEDGNIIEMTKVTDKGTATGGQQTKG